MLTAPVAAELTGKIANSANRYRHVPQYRTSETYLVRYRTPPSSDLGTYLVRASDATVHGPFGSLDAAETWVGQNGGGYVDWGSSANMIPDHGTPGQISLLHFSVGSGLGWSDWRNCEEHPRAFIGCGHGGAA
ncbi:hypothetical protein [Amycolatopsis sp. NPDC051371]|uniref:hypothetical protein n=1 Tax=Amycolatopsis sp. NPDC051371 TaxID=3155800 RepID=UPI00344A9B75